MIARKNFRIDRAKGVSSQPAQTIIKHKKVHTAAQKYSFYGCIEVVIANWDTYPILASGVYCNIENSSKNNHQLKYREMSFAHNLLLGCQIVLRLFTDHGSQCRALCKISQRLPNWHGYHLSSTHLYSKLSFWWISYIAKAPVFHYNLCNQATIEVRSQ